MLKELKNVVKEDEIVSILKKMISIPTYHGIKNQETDLANYIHKILTKEGIESKVKNIVDGRSNIIAKIRGNGKGKNLLLNGHLDTVEPNDMKDALVPRLIDGKLYGRGASDMKGPIAAMIAAIIAIKRMDIKLKGDLVFSGVIDEEHNSIGTINLIKDGINADAAIVGEPSDLEICIAHRGLEWFKFEFIGKTVHGGSQDEGVNAILQAVKFINRVNDSLEVQIKKRSHDILGNPTINVGVINGGTQLSTVPGKCEVFIDRRYLPSESYDQIVDEFQNIIDELTNEDKTFNCKMSVTEESRMIDGHIHEPMEIAPDHEIVKLLEKKLEEIERDPVKTLFPAWTDGALISNNAKIPTVVIGPGHIKECHSSTEHIEIRQLIDGYKLYALMALDYCGYEED